jgi:phospholipid/cholesterol/gamma-HCH transport system substrate-binding protein
MPSAQRIRWAKTRSFFTILIALSILSVLMYLLFGGNPFRPDVMLRVYVDDSGGMPVGSQVRLNGIPIGKVVAVELAKQPEGSRFVEVRLSVEAAALEHIPNDSIVEIGAENLLGDRLIDITAGRSTVPVQPGGSLQYQPPAEIDRAQVIASLEKNLRSVDALLDDIEAGRGGLARFLRDDAIYQSTADRLRRFEHSVRNARTAGALASLIQRDELYTNVQSTLARYDTLLADLEAGRGSAGEFLQSSRLHDDLRKQIVSVRQQIAGLSKNRFIATDGDYDRWNSQVERLIVAIDDINAGQGSLGQLLQVAQTYESLQGAAQNLQAFLEDFQQNPRKFLRVDLDLF